MDDRRRVRLIGYEWGWNVGKENVNENRILLKVVFHPHSVPFYHSFVSFIPSVILSSLSCLMKGPIVWTEWRWEDKDRSHPIVVTRMKWRKVSENWAARYLPERLKGPSTDGRIPPSPQSSLVPYVPHSKVAGEPGDVVNVGLWLRLGNCWTRGQDPGFTVSKAINLPTEARRVRRQNEGVYHPISYDHFLSSKKLGFFV